jgi:ribosome biogenesis GTPase A
LEKPEVILLTKTDLADPKQVEKATKLFKKKGLEVMTCSIYDEESLQQLKERVLKLPQFVAPIAKEKKSQFSMTDLYREPVTKIYYGNRPKKQKNQTK